MIMHFLKASWLERKRHHHERRTLDEGRPGRVRLSHWWMMPKQKLMSCSLQSLVYESESAVLALYLEVGDNLDRLWSKLLIFINFNHNQ